MASASGQVSAARRWCRAGCSCGRPRPCVRSEGGVAASTANMSITILARDARVGTASAPSPCSPWTRGGPVRDAGRAAQRVGRGRARATTRGGGNGLWPPSLLALPVRRGGSVARWAIPAARGQRVLVTAERCVVVAPTGRVGTQSPSARPRGAARSPGACHWTTRRRRRCPRTAACRGAASTTSTARTEVRILATGRCGRPCRSSHSRSTACGMRVAGVAGCAPRTRRQSRGGRAIIAASRLFPLQA